MRKGYEPDCVGVSLKECGHATLRLGSAAFHLNGDRLRLIATDEIDSVLPVSPPLNRKALFGGSGQQVCADGALDEMASQRTILKEEIIRTVCRCCNQRDVVGHEARRRAALLEHVGAVLRQAAQNASFSKDVEIVGDGCRVPCSLELVYEFRVRDLLRRILGTWFARVCAGTQLPS